MHFSIGVLLILAVCDILSTTLANQIDFAFYHKTDEINEELRTLVSSCEGYTLNESPDIYELSIVPKLGKVANLKALLIFGEHPREMISPETGLNIAKSLCGKSSLSEYSPLNDQIRDTYNLKLIINSNPGGRKLVEEGDYCKRENTNFVDINRNWDSHWKFVKDDETQVSSGESPFSEPETKSLRKIAMNFSPNVFITIHSGTLGLYTPYAYSVEKAKRNEKVMLEIVTDINDKYCKRCEVGAAGKEVGYLCPGTCLDYIYEDLQADYAFAFEIYEKKTDLLSLLSPDSLVQQKLNQIRSRTSKPFSTHTPFSCFAQNSSFTKVQDEFMNDDYQNCFLYFNPPSLQEYNFIVDNWTKAIFDTLSRVPLKKSTD